MKNTIIIILLLNVFGCGTDQGEGKTYTYTVKNESNKSIKIKAYQTRWKDTELKITILSNGEELTKTYQDGLPPSGYTYGVFFGGDSLVVIYDNMRYETFVFTSCSGSDKNPLNTCVYYDTEETFIFTEEDYENAEPCERECN